MTSRAPSLETAGMTRTFGPLVALDAVSIRVAAGSFHALLGENGAGKSTLVKCIMGFYEADSGAVLLDGDEVKVNSPKDARAHGIGMVYQHFTLVPCLTAAENLVISRADAPAVIDWRAERRRLAAFMDRMPFRVPLDARVSDLTAGEKQKLEILKLLYLDQRFLILDEPTSVLTPGEAHEVLGLLRGMAGRGEVTVLMISHKFREVKAFCDSFTVLRHGRVTGSGDAQATSVDEMSRMMVGDTVLRAPAPRTVAPARARPVLRVEGVSAVDAEGRRLLAGVSLQVAQGEILGIAGISGNGQAALVEVLSGQRMASAGRLTVDGQPFHPGRRDFDRFRVFGLPEEPLRNAAVPRMTVAENIAFRTFDKAPLAGRGGLVSPAAIRRRGVDLIARFRVRTPSPDAPIETLSGGNVQRAILARELSGEVGVLIAANPCFGLDFASVAEIRARIIEQRNRGAAVLLISEDLDEIAEMSDRIAVMSGGRIVHEAPAALTDRATLGRHMGS
ncbi:MAG: ABC transporter ATP-binding protein [Paracoccaceae bacterium]